MKNKTLRKNNIKRLREKRGLSSQALAKLIGVSTAHVSRLESGQSLLTKNLLLSLAAKLDVNSNVIADVPVSKKISADCDDALLGCAIGWLLEYSDEMKVPLSQQELSTWTNHIYKETITRPINHTQTRYLAYTIVKVIKSTRGK